MAGPEQPLANWPGRYRQLLADAGLDRDTVLAGAPATCAPGEPQELLSLAQCLEQPDRLRQRLEQDYPTSSQGRNLRAHLSLVQQDLALSVIGPLTLQLFCRGQAPLPDPHRIFLGPAQASGLASRWFHASTGKARDVTGFVEGMAELVSAWYPVFRQELGVSPGAYWSSIGLGLGAPFSAVWDKADAQGVCAMAQEWLEAFACDASRFIDWIPATFNDRQCAIPQRRGCCLNYLLPDGGYCGTCGIYRKSRLNELRHPLPEPVPDRSQSAQ